MAFDKASNWAVQTRPVIESVVCLKSDGWSMRAEIFGEKYNQRRMGMYVCMDVYVWRSVQELSLF